MDLKELFKRKAPGAAPASDDPVQTARKRARQRLVGAALLLVVGVVAFPLLFETKPRPLALDTPIVAARPPSAAEAPGSVAPAPLPVSRTAPAAPPQAPTASAPAEAAAPVELPAPAESPASAVAAATAATTATAATAAATATATAAAAAKPEPAKAVPTKPASAPPAAKALPKPGPAAPPSQGAVPATPALAAASAAAASAPRAVRYVVQVGAFSEAATAREVRIKVERLGLKTYTQVVETDGGKRTRVRVGPFMSREEAMQTLARIQAANLPGVVLAL